MFRRETLWKEGFSFLCTYDNWCTRVCSKANFYCIFLATGCLICTQHSNMTDFKTWKWLRSAIYCNQKYCGYSISKNYGNSMLLLSIQELLAAPIWNFLDAVVHKRLRLFLLKFDSILTISTILWCHNSRSEPFLIIDRCSSRFRTNIDYKEIWRSAINEKGIEV